MSHATETDCGPIKLAITEALSKNLNPIHLEVINESYMHNVPKGSESHFKVLVVSDKFTDLALIKVRLTFDNHTDTNTYFTASSTYK